VSAGSSSVEILQAFGGASTSQKAPAGDGLELHIDFQKVGREFENLGPDSHHFRRGDQHVWWASVPQQIQTLEAGYPAKASLQVYHSPPVDGSIMARPGVDAVSAWAAGTGIYPIHASGIERRGQGILFLGEGGRGKTTTALAMAQRGWGLIADDRAFLTRGDEEALVSGLYDTAILTEKIASLFGAEIGQPLGHTHTGKQAFLLSNGMRTLEPVALRAVIVLEQGTEPPYVLQRATTKQALAAWQWALSPTTQAIGPTANYLSDLLYFVKCAPVWSMTLGWDWDRIEDVVNSIIPSEG